VAKHDLGALESSRRQPTEPPSQTRESLASLSSYWGQYASSLASVLEPSDREQIVPAPWSAADD
jgi:hypothetical protein